MSENESLMNAAPIEEEASVETTNVETTEAVASQEVAAETVEAAPAVAESATVEAESFYDSLPNDLKKFESLKKFNSSEDLAKSYVELSNKLGKRLEDMSQDEIVALNSKFGVPAEAADYGLEKDVDGLINSESLANELKELGIPKHLGPKIMDHLKKTEAAKIEEANNEANLAFKRQQQETLDILKREYGVDYQERLNLARKAIRHEENGEAIISKLDKVGLGNDADIIKMFVKKGEKLAEDKLLGEDVGTFGMKRADAAEEISRLMQDKEFLESFRKPTHPGHEAAAKKWEELHRIKAGLR